MAKTLVACDFDGTVNRIDVGSNLVKALFPEKWEYIDRNYRAGKITNFMIYRDILMPAFRKNSVNVSKILSRFLVAAKGFTDFYKYCTERGNDVVIISDGFDIYIKAFLEKYGISPEYYANIMRQGGGGYHLDFPHHNCDCTRCGTCKKCIIKALKKKYKHVVYVGDGDSDICPSAYSSVFYGKKKILKKMRRNGLAGMTASFYFYDFEHLRSACSRTGRYKAVMFDLDGTLVDGFDIIYESFNHALKELGLPTIPEYKIRKVIGPALSEGFRRLVPEKLVEQGVKLYRSYYRERYLKRTNLFPPVREILTMLRDNGIITGLITNKKGNYARELTDYLRLTPLFDCVIGAEEGLPVKPDPQMMTHVFTKYSLSPSEVIYVGDSGIDGKFANNTGVDFMAVGMGLAREDELYRYRPVCFSATSDELLRNLSYLTSAR